MSSESSIFKDNELEASIIVDWLGTKLETDLNPQFTAMQKHALCKIVASKSDQIPTRSLKDKYPNFEVGLKCIIMVNPNLLVCSYIKWKSDVNK